MECKIRAATAVIDQDLRLLHADRRFGDLLTGRWIPGHPLAEYLSFASQPAFLAAINRARSDGTSSLCVTLQTTPPLTAHLELEHMPSGAFMMQLVDSADSATAIQDVPPQSNELLDQLARVTQERNLRRQMMETSGAIVVIIDHASRIVEFNRTAEQATGYSRAEITGKSVLRLIPAQHRESLLAEMRELLKTGGEIASEQFMECKDGQIRCIDTRHSVYTNTLSGKPLLISIGIDITERKEFEENQKQLIKRIEDALQETLRERNFRQQILDTAAAIICVIDRNGNIVEFNRNAEEISGYSKEEILGKPCFLLHPDDCHAQTRKEREAINFEQIEKQAISPWKTRKGDVRQILWHNSVFPGENGHTDFLIATGIDVTENIEVERLRERLFEQLQTSLQELHREREFRKSIVETSRALIVLLNEEGQILEFNRGCEEVSGYSRDEVIGKPFRFLLPRGGDPDLLRHFSDKPLMQVTPKLETGWKTKSGQTRWILWNNSTVQDPVTGALIVIGTGIDITDQKLARTELALANQDLKKLNDHLEDRVKERTLQLQAANQELEAFSYSVSHDLRAPLRHITGFIDLMEMESLTLDPQAQKYFKIISDSAKRMGTLIDDLLQFSRMGRAELSRTVVDLNELVSRVIKDLSHETEGRNIVWKIGKLPQIQCDPSMFLLVFQNLIGNAIKFTRFCDPAIVEIFSQETEKGTTVHIKDNGVGFDMQYSDKLFGVFQRLHSSKDFEGTGIGLANVRRILQRHGGTIEAVAAPDEGAHFSFSVPEAEV